MSACVRSCPVNPLVGGICPFANPQQHPRLLQGDQVASCLPFRNTASEARKIFGGADLVARFHLLQQRMLAWVVRDGLRLRTGAGEKGQGDPGWAVFPLWWRKTVFAAGGDDQLPAASDPLQRERALLTFRPA